MVANTSTTIATTTAAPKPITDPLTPAWSLPCVTPELARAAGATDSDAAGPGAADAAIGVAVNAAAATAIIIVLIVMNMHP